MSYRANPFFTSARGRLLFFNLLVVAVTLMVCGVAVLGFRHASQIQELAQQQTLDDMTGSMNLARDTASVATALCGCRRWSERWSIRAKPNA